MRTGLTVLVFAFLLAFAVGITAGHLLVNYGQGSGRDLTPHTTTTTKKESHP